MRPKRIAIVGGADSKGLAPFEDPAWEIWSCNNLYPAIPRRSRWFEIHRFDRIAGRVMRRGSLTFRGIPVSQYLQDLAGLGCPVYMREKREDVPNSVPYPLAAVTREFGRYFTSTPAFMAALAILEGAEEIGLWGIEMGLADEYARQKPCLEYLLGYARGRGIGVRLPEKSGLLWTPWLYGFEEAVVPEPRGFLEIALQNYQGGKG